MFKLLIYTIGFLGVLSLGTGPYAYMPCFNPTVAFGVLMDPLSYDIVKIEDAVLVYLIPPLLGTLTGALVFA